MIYISEYEVDRCYGGPEEGGWWYDDHSHHKVLAVVDSQDDGSFICRALNDQARQAKETPDRFSMGCVEPDICFLTEDKPGEHETVGRPHYE
jgi:hypothetical protein